MNLFLSWLIPPIPMKYLLLLAGLVASIIYPFPLIMGSNIGLTTRATALTNDNQTSKTDLPSAAAYYQRAEQRQKAGDIFAALADYDQAIEIDPTSAIAYNNRGLLKQQIAQFNEAYLDFTQAIRLQSQYAEAHLNRALLREKELNNEAGALKDYSRAIEINPRLVKAYLLRAEFNLYKDNDSALADCKQALKLDPRNVKAYLLRGLAYQENSDYLAAALADFNRAIALDPKSAVAYNLRGILKENQKDATAALADYARSIALNPEFAAPYYNRANLRNEAFQDQVGAIMDYRQAANLYQKQDNTRDYEDVIRKLQELGVE
jgi:tetratricopeptide (TPR) repeat protein